MNFKKEIEDMIDLFQNRLNYSIKIAPKVGEYRYGQCKSYKEILEILKDLKKRMDRAEKIEEHKKEEEKRPIEHNIFKEPDLPVV